MQLSHITNKTPIPVKIEDGSTQTSVSLQGKRTSFTDPNLSEFEVGIPYVEVFLKSQFVALLIVEGLDGSGEWKRIERIYMNNTPKRLNFIGWQKVRFTTSKRYHATITGGSTDPLILTVQEVV